MGIFEVCVKGLSVRFLRLSRILADGSLSNLKWDRQVDNLKHLT